MTGETQTSSGKDRGPPTAPSVARARNFHEGFREEAVEAPKPAATGYVFAAVALIVAILFRNTPEVLWTALTVAAAFAVTARFKPDWLGPLNRLWFQFALLLNRVMSPVIMFVMFAVVVVPYGLAMQLVRDPLRRKVSRDQASFWIKRDKSSLGSMRNQF
jgi:uncharacterized membrane protein